MYKEKPTHSSIWLQQRSSHVSYVSVMGDHHIGGSFKSCLNDTHSAWALMGNAICYTYASKHG